MARTKLLAMILSMAVVMAGAVFNNALKFVEHSPTLLYLAGQFKMATGDTNAALDLIGRAASAGHSAEIPAPAKSSAPASKPEENPNPATVCSQHQVTRAKKSPKVVAAATAVAKSVRIARPAQAEVLLAGFSPDNLRIPVANPREFARAQELQNRLVRQQYEAFSKLEHLRMKTYTVVVRPAPRVMVDLPEALSATP